MTEISTERAFRPSSYGWTIFANDIPECLETHTHDSLRRPLSSPVTFTIPARREWFGQHRKVQGFYRFVRSSVERLATALGTRFAAVRPGVLLSRSRDIEADRADFGDELFPDIIAMMDGTARTLRDLLASFPRVAH